MEIISLKKRGQDQCYIKDILINVMVYTIRSHVMSLAKRGPSILPDGDHSETKVKTEANFPRSGVTLLKLFKTY